MVRNSPHARPLSADSTARSSMLLSMLTLPAFVKSSLPSLHRRSRFESRRSASSAPASGSNTPTDGFGNEMVLSSGPGVEGYFTDEDVTREKDRPMEEKSGVEWKFANQGLNLVSLAAEESSAVSRDPRFGNAGLARQLYIHALTYLLRGLPADLTIEEQLSVRSALPAGVVEPLGRQINSAYSPPAGPSVIHRTLASTIVQLFLIFQFILPYLKYFLSAAYAYEREHKISERVFSQTIETGKRGVDIAGVVLAMGDGKVGRTAAWVVDGVTGGIHEGLGEGMAIIGTKRLAELDVNL